MNLFNFDKKKEERVKNVCNCSGKCAILETTEKISYNDNNIYDIKVLGTGCPTCHKQYKNTKEAVKKMKIDIEVEYITDLENVMEYGIMSMPALVVNERVISAGKLLRAEDIERLFHKLGV